MQTLAIYDAALGQTIGQAPLSNEIDACFMHNQGLARAECKSGSQEHDLSRAMDTVFTIEDVAPQVRALRVRSLLATTEDNVLDKPGNLRALRSPTAVHNKRILSR